MNNLKSQRGNTVYLVFIVVLMVLMLGAGKAYFDQKKTPSTNLNTSSETPIPTSQPTYNPTSSPTTTPKKITPTKPISTPTPTKTSNYPNEKYINGISGGVYINYISTTKAVYEQSIDLKGSGFGNSARFVRIYNLSDPAKGSLTFTKQQGIISWTNTDVEFWVPTDKGRYTVEVEGEGSVLSNKVEFEVVTGSPKITQSSPENLEWTKKLTLQGTEFGSSSGSVTLLSLDNQDHLVCTIESWSETEVSCLIPSLRSGQKYMVLLKTQDERSTGSLIKNSI